tara:strand:- start:2795 stop:3031 length:237 start_codon:yes stop_codon:yes gene_type:complete
MQSKTAGKIHYAVEVAKEGKLSYILCRGFPSIGNHTHAHSADDGSECAQCLRVLKKTLRQNGDRFILIKDGGVKHDEN